MIPLAANLRDGAAILSLRVRLWLWTVLVFAVVQVLLALTWLALASDTGVATHLPGLFLFTVPVGLIAAGVAAWRLAGRAVETKIPLQTPSAVAERKDVAEHNGGVEATRRDIAHLQHELDQALQRLDEDQRAQESFLTDVSHELKTPIDGLMAEARSVAARSTDSEALKGFAGDVERRMQRLASTVDGLQSLARAGRAGHAQLRRERINVNDLALGALESCLPLARELRVRVVPHLYEGDDLDVHGDPDMLRALVSNLLRNALQFSPSEAEVELRVSVQGAQVELSIRDRGPGCPPDWSGGALERVQQAAKARAGRKHSSGLGLNVAQTVARRHGGGVVLRDAEGGGCEAIVTLPLAPAG